MYQERSAGKSVTRVEVIFIAEGEVPSAGSIGRFGIAAGDEVRGP